MLQAAAILIFVLLSFWLLVPPVPRTGTVLVPSQPAAATEAVDSTSTDFNEIGTLVFYPNNQGPVPYLMYLDASGNTASKALVFSALPARDYSSWSGARISVSGTVDREHVVVSRISYIGPP